MACFVTPIHRVWIYPKPRQFRTLGSHSEEVIQHTPARRQEYAKPPPLICAYRTRRPLEQHFVVQRQLATLDFIRGCGLRREGVERGGGQHGGRGHGEVQGHLRGAVELEDVEARDVVVGVCDDLVALWGRISVSFVPVLCAVVLTRRGRCLLFDLREERTYLERLRRVVPRVDGTLERARI